MSDPNDANAGGIRASSHPAPEAQAPAADPQAQAAADALMAQAHIRANFAAKAFVEAISAVGEGARMVTSRGLVSVSDVRAHGPLIVIDGFVMLSEGEGAGEGEDKTEPMRMAVHPDALSAMIVLPQD